jgi:hypothetical protein
MSKAHRYTGEWPPLDVLDEYKNWEYALDEECEEGQDETTIRPEPEQLHLTSQTAFTTGTAMQADGVRRRGILGVILGKVQSVDVLLDDNNWRTLMMIPSGWRQSWLPKEQADLALLPSDRCIFPLHVISDLPDSAGERLDLTIEDIGPSDD